MVCYSFRLPCDWHPFQAGTNSSDWATAAVSQSVTGVQRVILAGSTKGYWDLTENLGEENYVMISLDVGDVDMVPTPAPSHRTPAPSEKLQVGVSTQPPTFFGILAPEPDATPSPTLFRILTPDDTTPSPTRLAAFEPEHETLVPTPAPQDPGPIDVASIIGVVALGVVAMAFCTGCFRWILSYIMRKVENKNASSPEVAVGVGGSPVCSTNFCGRCRPKVPTGRPLDRRVSVCKSFVLAVMALLAPADVGSDIVVIWGYLKDSHSLWATALIVFFAFSCRFTVAFAALHPPPDIKVLSSLYMSPFPAAVYHQLAFDEPGSGKSRSGQAVNDRSAKLGKEDAKKTETCLGSFLPTFLRSVFTVRSIAY